MCWGQVTAISRERKPHPPTASPVPDCCSCALLPCQRPHPLPWPVFVTLPSPTLPYLCQPTCLLILPCTCHSAFVSPSLHFTPVTLPPSLCHPASPYHPAFVPPHPASLKPSCHHHCTSQPQALTLVPRLPRSFHPNQRPRELVNVLSSQNWFRNDLYLLLLECKQSKNFKSCKW